MNKKSFWNVSKVSLFLAIVLVILVIWNYLHILDVRSAIRDEINTLEGDRSVSRVENARLKAENERLKTRNTWLWNYSAGLLQENSELKSFLEDMNPEITRLVKLSQVRNCCYVPPDEAMDVALDIVKMGERLKYFAFMIGQLTRDSGRK